MAISTEEQDSEREAKLIESLRDEAQKLKDCITSYSFRALSVGSIAAGTIFQFIWNSPILGIGGGFVAFIALATCRMCTHKLASSNRHFGYELHLARTRDVGDFGGSWKKDYRNIGWEEALRAWRIVQPTIFKAMVSRATSFLPDSDEKGFERGKPLWHRQESLIAPIQQADSYPGSYIRSVLTTLEFLAGTGAVISWIMVLKLTSEPPLAYGYWPAFFMLSGAVLFALMTTMWTGLRVWGDHRRRRLLEDDVLSIHSCAVIWQATVVAHYMAIARARYYQVDSARLGDLYAEHLNSVRCNESNSAEVALENPFEKAIGTFEAFAESKKAENKSANDGAGLFGYTFWLGLIAADASYHCSDLPKWIGSQEPFKLNEKERPPYLFRKHLG